MATLQTNVRKVLITGAAGSLGKAVVQRFQQAGIHVVGTDLAAPSGSSPETTPDTWIATGLAEFSQVERAFQSIAPEIDAVVHCAGGFRYAPVRELSDSDLQFLLDANLKSSFNLARFFSRAMIARGFGRMVFVGAHGARSAGAGMAAYAASKAGVHALVEALSKEVEEFNINVNAVLPTTLDTPANRKDMPQANFSAWVRLPDLAEVIFSLTQPYSQAVHGSLISVGGRTPL